MAAQMVFLRLARVEQQVNADEIKTILEATDSIIPDAPADTTIPDKKTAMQKTSRDEQAPADSLVIRNRLTESENLLDMAMTDFNTGRRSVAQAGFEDIIRRFSDTPAEGPALYWLGECLYAQKLKQDAKIKYAEYVMRHPSGNKLCPALFKLGLIYHADSDTAMRNSLWKRLLETCPKAEETEIAKARMLE
jgi:TolA-binding protein